MDEENINEFEIKSPRIVLAFLIVLTCVVLGCAGVSFFFYLTYQGDDRYAFIILVVICIVFLALLCIIYYVYFKEKFIFKDEIFTYIKPFRRAQSVSAADIECVYIKNSILIKVVIVDVHGAVAMSFYDDGTAFRSGQFIQALTQRKIPIKNI